MAYLEDTKQHRIPRSPTRVVWYHSIPPELGSTEGIVACIVCNTAGSLVDGFARSVRAALAYQTETLAFVHTLYFLSPRSSLKLELNSDCLNLISLLKSTDQRGWKSEHLSPKLLIFSHKLESSSSIVMSALSAFDESAEPFLLAAV